jgi:hypothetical protein
VWRSLLLVLGLAACGSNSGPAWDLGARDDALLVFPDLVAAGDARGDGARADLTPDLIAPFSYLALNHLLCTGQSLSVGSGGSPALSTTQPFENRMFSTGVLAGGKDLTSLVPLVEAKVETISSGLANLVTQLARDEVFKGRPAPRDSHDLLVSCHGVGGQPYSALKKGTTPYANGIAQVVAAKALAGVMGVSHGVRAITVVHGESDHVKANTQYAADLAEWQADYEADILPLTGQKLPVPFFHTQISSWTKYGSAVSSIPIQQLAASVGSGGKIMLVGPKYFLPYIDGVHLTNKGYRQLGEYHAKAYRSAILEGRPWEPLRPIAVSRSGAKITVRFHVPVPPLVLDTTLVSNPGSHGFEFFDASAKPPKVASVTLVGPDLVEITLTAVPTGAKQEIRYAYRGVVDSPAGPKTGPRGNLRDSDATVSRHGYALYNWAVHFAAPVPTL